MLVEISLSIKGETKTESDRESRSEPIKKLTKSAIGIVLAAYKAGGPIVLGNSTRGKKFDMFFKRSKLAGLREALIPQCD